MRLVRGCRLWRSIRRGRPAYHTEDESIWSDGPRTLYISLWSFVPYRPWLPYPYARIQNNYPPKRSHTSLFPLLRTLSGKGGILNEEATHLQALEAGPVLVALLDLLACVIIFTRQALPRFLNIANISIDGWLDCVQLTKVISLNQYQYDEPCRVVPQYLTEMAIPRR